MTKTRKSTKGGNGTGSIFQSKAQKKTGMFTIAVTIGYSAHGKRERVRRFADSHSKAEKLRTELLHRRDSGTLSKTANHTVRTYGEEWVELKAVEIRPSTAHDYKDVLQRYVFPKLGSIRMSDLQASHVQKWIKEIAGVYSPYTVNYARRVLHGLCQHAWRSGVIAHNPVKATSTVPRRSSDKTNVCEPWSMGEVTVVLTEAINDDRLDCFLHLMLHTGLRPGEALGLRWEDVDFDKEEIRVTGTLKQERRVNDAGVGVVRLTRNEPKTKSSNRPIQMTVALKAALHRQLIRQEIRQIVAGKEPDIPEYVVASDRGTPVNPSNQRRFYQQFLTRIGVRYIRMHDLRHTVAYMALQHDVPLEHVSQALGHTRIDTTKQIYAGYVPRMTQVFTQGLGAVLPQAPDPESRLAELQAEIGNEHEPQ